MMPQPDATCSLRFLQSIKANIKKCQLFILWVICKSLKKYFENTDFELLERSQKWNNFQLRIAHKSSHIGLDIFPVYEYPQEELTPELNKEIFEKRKCARAYFDKKYKKKKTMTEKEVKLAHEDILKIHEEMILPKGREMGEKPILFHGVEFPFTEGYLVIPYDDIVNGEKQVVIWLLQGLGDGVKLAFIRTTIIGLRLSWY